MAGHVFHVKILNCAPFEIEAKEGIEEVCKQVPGKVQSFPSHTQTDGDSNVVYIKQHMNTHHIQ